MRISDIKNSYNCKQNFGIGIENNDTYKEVYQALNFDLRMNPEQVDEFFKSIKKIDSPDENIFLRVLKKINPFNESSKKLIFLPLEKEEKISYVCTASHSNGIFRDCVNKRVTQDVYLPFFVKDASTKQLKQKIFLYRICDEKPIDFNKENILHALRENYQITGKLSGKKLSEEEVQRLDNIVEIGRDYISEASPEEVSALINLPEKQYKKALELLALKSNIIIHAGLGLTSEETQNTFDFSQAKIIAESDDYVFNLVIQLSSLKDEYFGNLFGNKGIFKLFAQKDIHKQLFNILSDERRTSFKKAKDIKRLADVSLLYDDYMRI